MKAFSLCRRSMRQTSNTAGMMLARSFSTQGNPMAMFEQLSKDAMNKLQDNIKEPMENVSRQVTEKSVEKISAVVNAMILLSRSNLMSEEELDSKLGQLLPPKMVQIVKEQSKLLPPDPYMEELKSMQQKLDALEEEVKKIKAA